MNTIFPFGFPLPTAFYLTLYVLTLVVHVIFMNYVLAGSAYLAWVSVFTGGPNVKRHQTATAYMLRDWMPFALGAAITAGVAPLLFIQIVYKEHFYTANLLLEHRWMSILPVLIIGFYLLYLLKSQVITNWPGWVRLVVGVGAFVCFGFVAYSWTENHLLSLQDRSQWALFYGSGDIAFYNSELVPRLALWFFGAFPTLAVLVAWQMWTKRHQYGKSIDLQRETRRLAIIALAGLFFAALAAIWYYAVGSTPTQQVVTSPLALPYLVAALTGLIGQAVVWFLAWRDGGIKRGRLILVSIAAGLAIVGVTVVREGIRISAVDMEALYDEHAEASRVGGLVVFVFFALVNAVLIGWCIRIVQREQIAHSSL